MILSDTARSRIDTMSGSFDPMKSIRSRFSFTVPSLIPVCSSMEPDVPVTAEAAIMMMRLAASLMFVRPCMAVMKASLIPKASACLYRIYGADSSTLLTEILFLGFCMVLTLS
jgi:hypothetical protein